MPTVAERLAILEQLARENRERLEGITRALNGGEGVEWERSVRGRLHTIESYVTSKKWLTEYSGRRIKRWHAAIIIACGLITTVCSVVAAIAVLTG